MTKASEKDNTALERVPCIHYPVWFKKDEIQAQIDSGSEVNAMAPGYASKLGLNVRRTNIGAEKIDGSTLKIFGIVLVSFQVKDKLKKAQFFQKTFLLADISVEVVLKMPFLTFSNANIQFAEKKLTWRSYTTAKALLTTK